MHSNVCSYHLYRDEDVEMEMYILVYTCMDVHVHPHEMENFKSTTGEQQFVS